MPSQECHYRKSTRRAQLRIARQAGTHCGDRIPVRLIEKQVDRPLVDITDIAEPFGVRDLANHHDADIVPEGWRRSILAEGDWPAA